MHQGAGGDIDHVVSIVHLYRLLLKRVADRGGLLHHAQRLAQNESLESVAASLLRTDEGRSVWACLSETEIARRIWQMAGEEPDGFRTVWNRGPTLAGFVADLVQGDRVRQAPVVEMLFPHGVDPAADDVYPAWAYRLWSVETERALQAAARRLFPALRVAGPKIGLVIEMAPETRTDDLDATVASLSRQIYGRWRLVLRGALPTGFALPPDPRIRLAAEPDEVPEGGWIGWLEAGDVLSPAALALMGYAARRRPRAVAIRCDEDWRRPDGFCADPVLRPAWDPVAAERADSSGGLVLFRASRLQRRGGTGPGLGPSSRLRLATARAAPVRIVHLPAVLCHRLYGPAGSSRAAGPALAAQGRPSVSVVIATRDRAELLARCVESLRACTDYPRVQIVLVDNGSVEPTALALLDRLGQEGCLVLSRPGRFNWSALNNDGVRAASGEIVVLLNNDVECVESGWLGAMVRACLRPDAGVVGALLRYADGTVQHAGVTVGPGAQAAHLRGDDPRAPSLHSVAAVTGACMAFRRTVFDRIGGLDARLPVTWNDIDFCLRVRKAGLRVLLTRDAVLVHDELGTRTPDSAPENQPQLRLSRARVVAQHGAMLRVDPFFNPLLVAQSGGLCLDSMAPRRLWPIILEGGIAGTKM